MGESDLSSRTIVSDVIRTLFSTLDRPVYLLLGIVYELFFNVASADIFSNETIFKFYGRVQVILGIFMMFQLAMTILKGIVNPDTFTGDKGARAIITKIVTALVLLTLLMPVSIPSPKNEYEIQINNNGILFGTLYSLQHRILANNTIGRLVLGSSDVASEFKATSSYGDSELRKSARIFTSTIIKGFYRINLIPQEERDDTYLKEGKDPAAYNENRVCTDIPDDVLERYTKVDADPMDIISMVNETCTIDFNIMNYIPFLSSFAGSKKYAFVYTPVISMIVGIVFVFILLSFTIDVAVRSIKLAVLRLLAPIPIISYMDPKGSSDSSFNKWVKALTSTYIDLFIRLAVVYFVLFLIQDLIIHGIVVDADNGFLLVATYIVIFIGLFVFAKQAPKFIKQFIGMKDDDGKLFSGFGEMFGAAAIGAGTIGSFNAARQGSRMADETNGKNPDSFINRGKHLLAGFAGGFSGARTGFSAWQGAKDHQGKAVMDAIGKQNATKYSQGDAGSTMLGRMGTTLSRAFTGESTAARTEREIGNWESRQKALDAIKSRVSGEMVKQDWTYGTGGNGFTGTDGSGSAVSLNNKKFNYKNFTAQMEQAKASGSSTVTVRDSTGAEYRINYSDAELMKGVILKNNEDDYIQKARLTDFTDAAGVHRTDKQDAELVSLIQDAMEKGGSGWDPASKTYARGRKNNITSRDDYTKTSEGLGQDIRDARRANAKAKADDLYSGK